MLCGKLGELLPMNEEHRIRQPENRVGALPGGGFKSLLEVVRASQIQKLNL